MEAGRIVLVNHRAEEIFGWPRTELLGQHAEVLLTDAARSAYPSQLLRHSDGPLPGPMGTLELTARRRDASEFPVEATLAAVETRQGRVVIAVVRDLTERQRAEEEKSRLRDEARTHRNQRLESLGQLAGGIAHDFNNMLGVIVNYAHFVIEESEADRPDLAVIAADARQVIKAGE